MQTGRKVFLLVIAGVVTCGMYLFMDDDLGRPDRPIRLDLGPPVYVPVFGDPHRARFTICSGPIRANCVVDGDTFWFEGTKIRISDIDAPEISELLCPSERQAGEAAKRRLLELLNDGSFSLNAGWRDEDRFGRKLRVVSRDYRSLGEMLVKEGLARNWDGPRLSWCN